MQVTGKILPIENAKISENNKSKNQTSEKRSTIKNIEPEVKFIEMKLINEVASTMRNDASDSSEKNVNTLISPRNVILLLIDERDGEREEISWRDVKERLPFASEGFLEVYLP